MIMNKQYLIRTAGALIMSAGWGYLAYKSRMQNNMTNFRIDLIISVAAAIGFIVLLLIGIKNIKKSKRSS